MHDMSVHTDVGKAGSAGVRPRRLYVHVRGNGERFPIVEGPDRVPDADLCTYAAAILRPRSGSVNTMLQELRGAMALKEYCDAKGVDLDTRIREGIFLHLHEQTGFDAHLSESTKASAATRSRRLRGALRYMKWKWRRRATELSAAPGLRASYQSLADDFREAFESVIPAAGDSGARRAGLDDVARTLLLGFLRDQAAVAALWTDRFAAARNTFLVKCLLLLGHRVGEFLSLTLDDLDLGHRAYTIRRSHDCAADPRLLQPLVKGFQRDLRWPTLLVGDARSYLVMRAALPYASGNRFLFVTREGIPLSRSMVAKVFAELRGTLPGLGPRFCPHVLRHTWNEMFSVVADRFGHPEEKAIRARMLAMGWRSRETAKAYTAQADKRAADEVSQGMQSMIIEMSGGGW